MPARKGHLPGQAQDKTRRKPARGRTDGNGDSTEDTTTADDANSPDPQEPPN